MPFRNSSAIAMFCIVPVISVDPIGDGQVYLKQYRVATKSKYISCPMFPQKFTIS